MEQVLILAALVVLFALGPVLAFLDVLSRELLGGAPGFGFVKAFVVLFVPFAWIVWFVVVRRRRPFAEDFED
jgi:hypothetical protein